MTVVIYNKALTIGSGLVAAMVLMHTHLHVLLFGFVAFFLFFPLAYISMKFSLSDCINKPYVMEKSVDEDVVMVFKDGRRNMRISEFIDREMLNANFWLTVVSFIMICIGTAHS